MTSNQVFSASGSSTIKIYSLPTSTEKDCPIAQVLKDAHPLGCHHICTSGNGTRAASVGFGGEVKTWTLGEGMWLEDEHQIKGEDGKKLKAGEVWAVTLTDDGKYLIGTSTDGKIGVWDLSTHERKKIREYETKGSFGTCVHVVSQFP